MPTILNRRQADNPPRKWPTDEQKRLLNLLKGSSARLAELQSAFPDRTLAAIRSKVRKLRIKHDLFGRSYRDEKAQFSVAVANAVNPETVFDAYAGAGHQTLIWAETAATIYAAEKIALQGRQFVRGILAQGFRECDSSLHNWRAFEKKDKEVFLWKGDAIDAAVSLRYNGRSTDLLDMDTCGSAIPALPIFLNLLKPRHLVITHGEFHSLRFGREDVLRRTLCHRSVNSSNLPKSPDSLKNALIKADKLSALRCDNETAKSRWLILQTHQWLGSPVTGMLRLHYRVVKPPATSDCLNELAR